MPMSVSPGATVTARTGAAGAGAGTAGLVTVVGCAEVGADGTSAFAVRRRQPGADREEHERRRHQPLRELAGPDSAWRRVQARRRPVRRRGGQPTSLAQLRLHLDHDGDEEAQPDHPPQDGEHADHDGQLVAELDPGAPRPRVADERDEQHGRADDEGQQHQRRGNAADETTDHGGAPVCTPSSGPDDDVDETVRAPGRIRLSTVAVTVTVTRPGSTLTTPVCSSAASCACARALASSGSRAWP